MSKSLTQALRHRQNKGFTLVELMIALTIGLIIMAAVSQIFVTSRLAYTYSNGLARIQEAGRFAMDAIGHDLRLAGYGGCNSNLATNKINNIVDPVDDTVSFDSTGLEGFVYSGNGTNNTLADWTPALPADYFADGEVQPNTDVLILHYASPVSAALRNTPKAIAANAQFLPTADFDVQVGDILMLADCSSVDIFRATSVSGGATRTVTHASSGNTGNFLSKIYGADAELLKLVTAAYFVSRPDYDLDGAPDAGAPLSLQRKELVAGVLQTQVLLENVEAIRYLYGRDTDGDGVVNLYETGDDVSTAIAVGASGCPGPDPCADWAGVVSIRIGMAIGTPANVDQDADAKTYNLLGDSTNNFDNYGPTATNGYGTNNKRRRRVFTATIAKRN